MTLEEQLVRDEGCKLQIYQDSVGKWTVGVGRNLQDVGISRDEAMTLLGNDIQNAEARLEQELPWAAALDPVRRAVLLNMTFNMGIGGLMKFRKFLAALAAGDYKTASSEMLASVWAQQVGPRAQRLAIQIESGCWQ
jgi:lysozyme